MQRGSCDKDPLRLDEIDFQVPVYPDVRSVVVPDGRLIDAEILFSKFPSVNQVYGFIRVSYQIMGIVARQIRGLLWFRIESGTKEASIAALNLFYVRTRLYEDTRTYIHVGEKVLDWNPLEGRLTVIWNDEIPSKWQRLLTPSVKSIDIRTHSEELQRVLPLIREIQVQEITLVTNSSQSGIFPYLSSLPSVRYIRGAPRDQKDQSYNEVVGYSGDISEVLGSRVFPQIEELRTLLVPPRILPIILGYFPNIHSIDVAFERPGSRNDPQPLELDAITNDEYNILLRFQKEYGSLAFNLFLTPTKPSVRSPRRISPSHLTFSPDTKAG